MQLNPYIHKIEKKILPLKRVTEIEERIISKEVGKHK